jgi:glycosyltransferase involved in cell wall biosynthesis
LTNALDGAGIQWLRGWNETNDKISPSLVKEADLVIIQRDMPGYINAYQEIVALARKLNKPVVYETDDFLFELPSDHTDQHKQIYIRSNIPMLDALLQADMVTTSSMAYKHYLDRYNPRVVLLKNYLDDRFLLRKSEQQVINREYPVTIGYMGSPNHNIDLKFLEPVLKKIVKHHGSKLRFKFFGFAPPAWMRDLAPTQTIHFSHDDYGQFIEGFIKQNFDIALAPLAPIPFNQMKSAIKYLEYSALGIAGIYSDIPAYKEIVTHGKDGYIAASLDEWESYLYKLITDPDLRIEMGRQAQKKVLSKWLVSKHAHEWLDAYKQLAGVVPGRNRESTLYEVADRAARYQISADRAEIQSLKKQLSRAGRLLKTREAYIDQLQEHIKKQNDRINDYLSLWKAVQESKTWKLTNGLNNKLIQIGLKKK